MLTLFLRVIGILADSPTEPRSVGPLVLGFAPKLTGARLSVFFKCGAGLQLTFRLDPPHFFLPNQLTEQLQGGLVRRIRLTKDGDTGLHQDVLLRQFGDLFSHIRIADPTVGRCQVLFTDRQVVDRRL